MRDRQAEIRAGIDDPIVVHTLRDYEVTPREEAAIEAAYRTFMWHTSTLSSGPRAGITYAVIAALRAIEPVIDEPPA
jgi:hypothetical protein